MSKSIFARINGGGQSQEISPHEVMRQYKSFNGDHSKIFDVMLQNGRISQQQYNDIIGMDNPLQVIQYLTCAGVMDKNPLMRLFGRR